jgi:hypothetical protein
MATKTRKTTKPAVKSLKSRADLVDEILSLTRSLKTAKRDIAVLTADLRKAERNLTAPVDIDEAISVARRWHYGAVTRVAEDAMREVGLHTTKVALLATTALRRAPAHRHVHDAPRHRPARPRAHRVHRARRRIRRMGPRADHHPGTLTDEEIRAWEKSEIVRLASPGLRRKVGALSGRGTRMRRRARR